jgi:hypothetical protein
VPDEVASQCRENFVFAFGISDFENDVLTFNIAGITQALRKRREDSYRSITPIIGQDTNPIEPGLLPAHDERPRRRSAKRANECSPLDVNCHPTLPRGHAVQWRTRYHARIAPSAPLQLAGSSARSGARAFR